jgi:hypothetical protein
VISLSLSLSLSLSTFIPLYTKGYLKNVMVRHWCRAVALYRPTGWSLFAFLVVSLFSYTVTASGDRDTIIGVGV